jgi:hypothetical protein
MEIAGKLMPRKSVVILAFAFVGWALCGAIMGIGQALTTIENTLIAHALGAPIIFAGITRVYMKRYAYTTPLQTALLFLGFVVFMDVFVVSLLVLRSFEMFTSLIGTWIPFTLIFLSVYFTGIYLS